jgi:protoporphyrinogen oxidase
VIPQVQKLQRTENQVEKLKTEEIKEAEEKKSSRNKRQMGQEERGISSFLTICGIGIAAEKVRCRIDDVECAELLHSTEFVPYLP